MLTHNLVWYIDDCMRFPFFVDSKELNHLPHIYVSQGLCVSFQACTPTVPILRNTYAPCKVFRAFVNGLWVLFHGISLRYFWDLSVFMVRYIYLQLPSFWCASSGFCISIDLCGNAKPIWFPCRQKSLSTQAHNIFYIMDNDIKRVQISETLWRWDIQC